MLEPGGAACRFRCLPSASLQTLAARFAAHVHAARQQQRAALHARLVLRGDGSGDSSSGAVPMEVEAAASETETGSASSVTPPLLLLDGCARAPPPGSLKAAGVRDGDTLGALAAVAWCPTCGVELGGQHWSCPSCGQDAEALSRAAHCSNVALVDLVTERALAPQTASFAEGWVCSQCLFYNPWQLSHLSTLPSKDGTTRESRHTSAAANAAAAAANAATATAAAAAANIARPGSEWRAATPEPSWCLSGATAIH